MRLFLLFHYTFTSHHRTHKPLSIALLHSITIVINSLKAGSTHATSYLAFYSIINFNNSDLMYIWHEPGLEGLRTTGSRQKLVSPWRNSISSVMGTEAMNLGKKQ